MKLLVTYDGSPASAAAFPVPREVIERRAGCLRTLCDVKYK